MNNRILVSLMLGALPLTMVAQDDDMYFVPAKKSTVSWTHTNATPRPAPVYYSGSNRDVDEYNRRGGSYYQVVSNDSTGNDIIDFNGELGVYPDSVQTEDYALTRQMSRWDGYEPEEAYREGYRDGRMNSLSWHSPWYYSSYYPWYDPWYYDPWYYGYYGWYGGWYDPWYYGYSYYHPWYHSYWYGGYYPYYGGGGGYITTTRTAGTQHHGRISYSSPRGISNGRTTSYSAGTFGGRSLGSSSVNRGTFGTSRSTSSRPASRPTSSGTRVTNSYGNFGGNRTVSSSSSRSYTPSYSSGSYSSGSSGSSGSFGGGGSRSSGGGGYGGSRSSGGGGGGGGHFGGRR